MSRTSIHGVISYPRAAWCMGEKRAKPTHHSDWPMGFYVCRQWNPWLPCNRNAKPTIASSHSFPRLSPTTGWLCYSDLFTSCLEIFTRLCIKKYTVCLLRWKPWIAMCPRKEKDPTRANAYSVSTAMMKCPNQPSEGTNKSTLTPRMEFGEKSTVASLKIAMLMRQLTRLVFENRCSTVSEYIPVISASVQ